MEKITWRTQRKYFQEFSIIYSKNSPSYAMNREVSCTRSMRKGVSSHTKDHLNHLCCTMKVNKHCNIYERRCPSQILYVILHSHQFKKLNLCKSFLNRVIGHLMSILISIFISGYHGKTTDFA